MSFVDAMFESQSGFSTTGATVISDLEDPRRVPHCILFWRSGRAFWTVWRRCAVLSSSSDTGLPVKR